LHDELFLIYSGKKLQVNGIDTLIKTFV